MSETKELAVPTESTQIAVNTAQKPVSKFTQDELDAHDLGNAAQLPDVTDYAVEAMSLSTGYWSGENPGDQFMGFVVGVETKMLPKYQCKPEESHILYPVDVVTLVRREENKDGAAKMAQYECMSKMLVSTIKSGINSGRIIPFSTATPIIITYLGRKRNKTNQLESKHFDVGILVGK